MAGGSAKLGDLDDACLTHVLSFLNPLPDRFNLAASCRRLRDLALDRRAWLVVSHTRQEVVVGIPRQHREHFLTLEEAINASRPGDTILLMPGEPHRVCCAVIPWPLHIMGGGTTPEQTVLTAPRGAPAALDFRSSGRLFNLTISSQLGTCVTHRRGRLAIEQCSLSCEAEGLQHLVFPIATLAASPPALHPPLPRHSPPAPSSASAQPTGSPAAVAVAAAAMALPPAPCRSGAQPAGAPAVAAAAARGLQASMSDAEDVGPGVLSVVESRIKGSGRAIQLLGTGGLANVRFIYLAHHTLFWFDVNSSVPGRAQHAQRRLAQLTEQREEVEARASSDGGRPGKVVCGKRRAWDREKEGPVAAGGEGAAVQLRGSGSGGSQPTGTPTCVPPPAPMLLPAWVQCPPFDPLAFQRRVREEEAARQAQGAAAGGPLQKKAQQWSRHHAATLGDLGL